MWIRTRDKITSRRKTSSLSSFLTWSNPLVRLYITTVNPGTPCLNDNALAIANPAHWSWCRKESFLFFLNITQKVHCGQHKSTWGMKHQWPDEPRHPENGLVLPLFNNSDAGLFGNEDKKSYVNHTKSLVAWSSEKTHTWKIWAPSFTPGSDPDLLDSLTLLGSPVCAVRGCVGSPSNSAL